MQRKALKIENWSGGLSDSPLMGIKGSYAEGVGLNIHEYPHLLTVNQKLTKNSGSVVTELCKNAVNSTDGSSYWFSTTTGKIWKRTSTGTWSLIHTNANGACVGAKEWDDYIYFASNAKLGRYGPLSDSAEWTDSWNNLTSASFHPMEVQSIYLIIGNASTVATVDDTGTFTANGTSLVPFISLPSNQIIRSIRKFGGDILMGTYSTDNNTPAMLIRWDCVSQSYLSDPPDIPETSIQTIITQGTYAYVIAGNFGKIYYYDGTTLVPFKIIPGDYTSSAYINCYSEAECKFLGRTCFGISNGQGNSTLQGIYSLGQHDRNYPIALNLDYPISTGETSSLDIGVLLVIDKDLYVSWKTTTNVGIDKIDWSLKQENAYIKQLVITGDREKSKIFRDFVVNYKSKPSGTNLTLDYYANYTNNAEEIFLRDKSTDYKFIGEQNIPCGALQARLTFTVSGNNAPIVESIYITFDEEQTL